MSRLRRLVDRFRHTHRVAALQRHQDWAEPALARALARLDAIEPHLGAVEARLAALEHHLGATEPRLGGLEQRLAEQERLQRVRAVMDWIERVTLADAPLVSVIMPTRDRAAWLARAIASVTAQSHANWELLVIDDASRDGTAALLAELAEPRLRVLRGDGRGACAARNRGLEAARGSILAYLDDDNLMHPHWLKAVAWAFAGRPEADVLYGAFLVDDPDRILRTAAGAMPQLYLHPYDHRAVAHSNVADMGCIAHRAGLPEARFDEGLREMGDWDLLLRITRDKPPLLLPAIACFYTTDAPNRLSNGPTFAADLALVRERNRR